MKNKFSTSIVKFIKLHYKLIIRLSIYSLITVSVWLFIKNEKKEVQQIDVELLASKHIFILIGIISSLLFLFVQGYMYKTAFKCLDITLKLTDTVVLFIKRNFKSIFLPAGGVTALSYSTTNIQHAVENKDDIHMASGIYAFCGMLTVFIISIPTIIYSLFKNALTSKEVYSFVVLSILIALLLLIIISLLRRGVIYTKIVKYFPNLKGTIEQIINRKINKKAFIFTILISLIIEFTGMFQLGLAMISLGFHLNYEAIIIGYVVSTILLVSSPVLKGVGLIEASLVYILMNYGFTFNQALSISLLYRLFEFWVPFLVGALTAVLKRNNIILRLLPALSIAVMGIVNIGSATSIFLGNKMPHLNTLTAHTATHVSNLFLIFSGVALLAISIYLARGFKFAFVAAIAICVMSSISHVLNGNSYTSAIFNVFNILALLITRNHYYIISKIKTIYTYFTISAALVGISILYGLLGFYFLDTSHYGINFTLLHALQYSAGNFFMLQANLSTPNTEYARILETSLHLLGGLTVVILFYALIKKVRTKSSISDDEKLTIETLVNTYGKNELDYFKTYFDKEFFISKQKNAFISYKTAKGIAFVLETPIAQDDTSASLCVEEFETYCKKNSHQPVYYRIGETDKVYFAKKGKHILKIGQQAIVDLTTFNLQGAERKSLRNAIHNLSKKGYSVKIFTPPISDGVIQKLKAVSNEWMEETGYHEIGFSQGIFDQSEIKKQTILALQSEEEKIVAFVNIFPDNAPGEGSFDLIRKTHDAPNGAMDFLMVELFTYFIAQGKASINLGFVALSGMDNAHTDAEKIMAFAYQKIKHFSNYKSLRHYKDKFGPYWIDKYLVYDADLQLPRIIRGLNQVIKI